MKKAITFRILFEGNKDSILEDIEVWRRITDYEKAQVNNTQIVSVERFPDNQE